MKERIISHTSQDVYNTPTPPDKIELTSRYIAQDLATNIATDIDALYDVVESLKTV